MINEWNHTATGWAVFSDDRRMRYRLARGLRADVTGGALISRVHNLRRAVFVLINPSTADAFKPDPTVSRCMEFSRRWGCDVLEVVNLFAFISPYPEDLKAAARAAMPTGADIHNDDAILDACDRSTFVIAAWGRHGGLMERGRNVAETLQRAGVRLQALRVLDGGVPSHPLARGKSFIPYDVQLVEWRP